MSLLELTYGLDLEGEEDPEEDEEDRDGGTLEILLFEELQKNLETQIYFILS